MKKDEIRVGGLYEAKVNGRYTSVRVDAIRETPGFSAGSLRLNAATRYDVTNLSTGRKTTFRSAAKFRREVKMTPKWVEEKNDGTIYDQSDEMVPANPKVAEQLEQLEASEGADPTISPSASAEPSGATATTTEEGDHSSDPTHTTSGAHSAVSQPAAATVSPFARQIAATASAPTTSKLTAQQEDILATAKRIEAAYSSGQRVMVIAAGAGTGKTFTLKQLEQVLCGNGQYTAFNTELVEESKRKFTRAACNTTHSLAFRAVGKRFEHRLKSKRMRSHELAHRLGIEDFYVHLPEEIAPRDEHDKLQVRRLKASYLAGQVMVAIKKFCMSADREIGAKHFETFKGLDRKQEYTNSNRVRDYLIQFAVAAWADLSSETGVLPYQHDYYVKSWQLGTGKDRPIIAADYILLDEAQDTAPVMLDILQQQTHALIVLVGDDNQSIYKWRGAVNAMASFPGAPRRLLSKSFRFGQAVADVANAVLTTLDEPTDLVMEGLETIPSRVAEVEQPRCYLYRTNAAAIGKLLEGLETNKRGYLIGGPRAAKETLAFCRAVIDLQHGRGTDHQELGCFSRWEEVVAYSKEDEGQDLRLMVKLITKFSAEKICSVLEGMPQEQQADFVAGTAHRSKGKEWTSVRLGEDFPTANKLNDEERRLLYVAGTRAQHELDVSRCPTFCGGYDKKGGGEVEDGEVIGEGGRFVPGIQITYTALMPTPEAIAAYRIGQKPPNAVPAANPPVPTVGVSSGLSANGNGGQSGTENPRVADLPSPSKSAVVELVNGTTSRVVTYAKLPSGDWGLWASAEIKEGELVEVRTRSGAVKCERVGKIVEVNAQAKKWLATKG